MSLERKIIEGALAKKPLDVQEAIHEIMRKKVVEVVNEQQIVFSANKEEEIELTEEEHEAAFFEEFHAEYGHLPEDEQKEILAKLEEEAEGEDESKKKTEDLTEAKKKPKKMSEEDVMKGHMNTAKRWHGGGGSALEQFHSSGGKIKNDRHREELSHEIRRCIGMSTEDLGREDGPTRDSAKELVHLHALNKHVASAPAHNPASIKPGKYGSKHNNYMGGGMERGY